MSNDERDGTNGLTPPEGFGRSNRSKDHDAATNEVAAFGEDLFGLVRHTAFRSVLVNIRMERFEDREREREADKKQDREDIAACRSICAKTQDHTNDIRVNSEETLREIKHLSTRVWMLEVLRVSIPSGYVFIAAFAGTFVGAGAVAALVWRALGHH